MRLGASSLVVSVPKEWAEKYHLTGDSRLVIVPQPDGSLALYPESVPRVKPKSVTLNTSPDDPQGLLERRMVAAFLTDFDEIRIQSKGVIAPEQRQRIRHYLRLLTGYQIMESESSRLVIQNVAQITELNVERALHRAHTIALSMLKDAMKALQKRDENLAQAVIVLDEDVNQFYYLINKQLRRALLDPQTMHRLGLTAIDTINYSMILHGVERAADAAKAIARAVITLGTHDCPADILKLAQKNSHLSYRLLQDAVKAALTRDDLLANQVINDSFACVPMRQQAEKLMEQHLIKICEEMIPNITPEACALFGPRQVALTALEQVFQSLNQIASAASLIAEVAIWRAMETHLPPATPTRSSTRSKRSKSNNSA